MNSRLVAAGSAVHLWPFPALDAVAAPDPPPPEPVEVAPLAALEPAEQPAPEAAALAEERLAAGYAEGLRRGLEEGREQGRADGLAEAAATAARLNEQAARLAAILGRLGEPIAALQRPVEEAVAALALEIARRVIGGEPARSREYLVRLIREAVAKVPIEMGAPKVLLNPADLELVRELAPELGCNGAMLLADDTVEAGGCLVVADGDGQPIADRRWHPRAGEGVSQVNLTLSSRWRSVILSLFDGEED